MISKYSTGTKVFFAAAIIGAITAITFAIAWFGYVSGHCGVVRFYEQLYGVFVLVVWLVIMYAGILFTYKGTKRKTRLKNIGIGLVIIASLGLMVVGILTLRDVQRMNRQVPSPAMQF